MIDKRPALIARCAGSQGVVACVNFARDHDVLISVRGGGHNFAGKAVCDGGFVVIPLLQAPHRLTRPGVH